MTGSVLGVEPGEFRRELARAAEWVADYLDAVPTRPVTRSRPPHQREWLVASPLRDEGQAWTDLLGFVDREVAPYPCGNGHPAFFGWINSPPAPAAVVAELLAVALNPSNGMGEHALMDIERGVVSALAELAGLPSGTGGVLTSGGSTANLLCLATARTWFLRGHTGADFDRAHSTLVCYQAGDTHMSIARAARTIGLGGHRIRSVPMTADWRMDPDALRRAIAADRAGGLRPFCVVSTAGSTATGAVDPIADISGICREQGLWHHVDGAFGGLGAAHPDLAEHYAGIDLVDSLTVDPHKTLNVPIGCGAALVTHPERLRDAFDHDASYLTRESAWPWLSDYTLELTRPAGRALTTWAVLHQLGRTGVTALIDGYLNLTRQLRRQITDHPDLQLVAGGPWPVTCFTHRTTDSVSLARRIQDAGRAYLGTVEIGGRTTLRASICNHLTTEEDLHTLLDEIHTHAKHLADR
ncbi:aminotransferase class V-fold PLP-dependent enzyme [Longispora sp. K20-0274]|uniref:pyridoxal phosphate-dependent decarboxylase family protein n=1 Tax=Longispora sp. K20-0274 TaxID=3088255 RepID=UPI00399A346E